VYFGACLDTIRIEEVKNLMIELGYTSQFFKTVKMNPGYRTIAI
jgi:hypothetical protein